MGIGLIAIFIISLIASVHFATAQQGNPTLANTIQNLVGNINFKSDLDTAYMGLNFGTVTLQSFQNMIDSLPNSSWTTILYWYAVVEKYNIANQTTIERALDAATMLPNGLPSESVDLSGKPCFQVYDRYLIYGYFWANQYQYDQSKWNLTIAYNSYDAAVTNCKITYHTPPLWIYGDNTAMPYSGRYYDETGQSLDGYLEFYKFGITQALSGAENLWNFENSFYWNGAYYGYTGANGLYECEAGGFEQIIWKLYDYNTSLPNIQNLLTDVNNRYLSNLWNSPQWLDYVVQHANSNSQRRLENTQIDWQSIIGTYPLLSSSSQLEIQQLLNGSAYGIINNINVNQPVWSLLSNPSAGLYDPSTGLYRIHSDTGPSSAATALAANLLMDMGIIQTTATLAVPLEEIYYEYTYNIIDKDLYSMDFNTDSIRIPISSPGELTFLYGSTPVTCAFNEVGVWNVTFSSDWNSVISANYVGSLPTNRLYYPTNLNNNQGSLSSTYVFSQRGFQLPIHVKVQNGTNIIQIYANSTLVYNKTISIVDNSTSLTCEIPTSNITIGNYTIAEDVNGNYSNVATAGVTYLGDLNGDFKVSFSDLTLFVSDYILYYSQSHTFTATIDYNQDGAINFRDLTSFVHYYILYKVTINQ